MGFALTYSLKNKYTRTLVQIICTIAGIITFSRTFIIIWILINILSIRISIKNIRILAVGAALFVALITFGELFKLNMIRLKQFSSILNNEEGAVTAANDDSRSDTWAQYYDNILEKPLLGNGYGALSGYGIYPTGAHNSFIMVLGEGGIIPFIVFTGIYLYILYCGIKLFDYSPHIIMQGIAIFLFLLTFHNYWDNLYIVLITLWIYKETKIKKIDYEKYI
jgi:O-antigen ligase